MRFTKSVFIIASVLYTIISVSAVTAEDTASLPHLLGIYQGYNTIWYEGNDVDCFTMMQQKFYQGYTHSSYGSTQYAFIALDGQFDTLSFDLGHIDGERNGSGILRIYLDRELTNEIELTPDMPVSTITLQTEGIRQAELFREGSDCAYGIANITAYGGHTFKDEIIKLPVAGSDGERLYTCTQCGFSYTESIPFDIQEPDYLIPYQKINQICLDETEDPLDYTVTMGHQHVHGITIPNYGSYREVIYNLNGQYSQVSFGIGHQDQERMGSAVLRIYGDGELMKTDDLTYDMIDRTIVLNTENLTQLKLSCDGSDSAYSIYDTTGLEETGTQFLPEEDLPDPMVVPYEIKNLRLLDEDNENDVLRVMGISHKKGLTITNYAGYREALFLIDADAQEFGFTIGHLDGERLGNATLRIFGDDTLLKEDELTYDMIQRDYNVNLQGITQLKISYEGGDSAYGIFNVHYVKEAEEDSAGTEAPSLVGNGTDEIPEETDGTAEGSPDQQDTAWTCSNGHSGNTGNFCPECGEARPIDKCPNCGYELPLDTHYNFCPDCGTALT